MKLPFFSFLSLTMMETSKLTTQEVNTNRYESSSSCSALLHYEKQKQLLQTQWLNHFKNDRYFSKNSLESIKSNILKGFERDLMILQRTCTFSIIDNDACEELAHDIEEHIAFEKAHEIETFSKTQKFKFIKGIGIQLALFIINFLQIEMYRILRSLASAKSLGEVPELPIL